VRGGERERERERTKEEGGGGEALKGQILKV
jgi:hypothetical protein